MLSLIWRWSLRVFTHKEAINVTEPPEIMSETEIQLWPLVSFTLIRMLMVKLRLYSFKLALQFEQSCFCLYADVQQRWEILCRCRWSSHICGRTHELQIRASVHSCYISAVIFLWEPPSSLTQLQEASFWCWMDFCKNCRFSLLEKDTVLPATGAAAQIAGGHAFKNICDLTEHLEHSGPNPAHRFISSGPREHANTIIT